jgi:hypothetical protein
MFKTPHESARQGWRVTYEYCFRGWWFITTFYSFKVRIIKMYLREAYMKVHIGKYLQPIKKGPKKGYALSSLFLNFALEYTILGSRGIKKFKVYLNKFYKISIYVNISMLLE